jgi:hypothetical protein
VDGSRFDEMTKTLASASRRSLLKAGLGSAIGLAVGGFGVRRAQAAALREAGDICRKNGDCASGLCGPKDASGRRRCACITFDDCPTLTDGGVCDIGACVNGVCQTAINVGASCGAGDLCVSNPVCQPDGSCQGTAVTCTALSQCHDIGTCDPQTGLCADPPKADGTSCETGVPNSFGATCQSGSCICTPAGNDCGDRVCGPGFTTCGQPLSCGTCDGDQVCNSEGVCESLG